MNTLFVTGTDTGVGKTHVSCGLLHALRARGLAPFPLKLIETGCETRNGALWPEDGAALTLAAGLPLDSLEIVAPCRFQLPAAPATATRDGTPMRFQQLAQHVERARMLARGPLLIEGAGGALVPIGPDGSFADLAANMGWPALVVARDALGTLNHTLLTLEALARRKIPVRGVVLNSTGSSSQPLDHVRELRALVGEIPIWGVLPWQERRDPDATGRWLEEKGVVTSCWGARGSSRTPESP